MVVIGIYDYSDTTNLVPITLDDNDCYCTHNMNGADQLCFTIQRHANGYEYIAEEVKVEGFGNRFVIKKIEEQSDFVVVTCELDYDDWVGQAHINFRETNITLPSVLGLIIPTGWSVVYGDGVDVTTRTTVEYQEGVAFRVANAKELLDTVSSVYGVVFNFNAIGKVLNVINPNAFLPTGDYFMEDLNMSNLKFTGNSSNLITRLYVYGKKDESSGEYLTIASVNDGKEYLDDFSYSNRIIIDSVIDERYTVAENLKAYGESVLAEKCLPDRSYTFDISNVDGQMYLYKVVTIVDKNRRTRVNHQCVKYVEYVNHAYDKVTLSSTMPSIENIVGTVTSSQSTTTTKIRDVEESMQSISDLVLGTSGAFKWILDATTGAKKEFLILVDSTSVGTATKLFKVDENGLHYSSTGYNGTYITIINDSGLITGSSATYSDLTGKPQINGVTLVGDKSFSDLGLAPLTTSEIEEILV